MDESMAVRTGPSPPLFVGELDPSVTEVDLYDIFSKVGKVSFVRLCRDPITQLFLGRACVYYTHSQHAKIAVESLNSQPIKGRNITVGFSETERITSDKLFVKRLPPMINTELLLREIFAEYGTIISCRVWNSKGYGFVHFEEEQAAMSALAHGALVNGVEISVDLFISRQEREELEECRKHNTIYIENMSKTGYPRSMWNYCLYYGEIVDSCYPKEGTTDYGFVVFKKHEDAARAIQCLNGRAFGDQLWYVAWAWSKSKRNVLYLKNFDDSIDDKRLNYLFSEFGTITSCKVMLDSQGQSRGFGFVAFSTPENATKAVKEMNGKMIGKKPLYVAVAQSKEERKAIVEACPAQVQASGVAHVSSGLHLSSPLASTPGPQQPYFGQGYAGLVRPQSAGCGYEQFDFGNRPAMALRYTVPDHLRSQGQPELPIGVRLSGTPQQQLHQACPAQVQASGMAHASSGLHLSYPLAPTLGPQPPYFRQGYYDLVPLEPAGCGYEQQFVFGNLPAMALKYMMPDHLWSEWQPGLPVGVNRGGIPQLQLLQM